MRIASVVLARAPHTGPVPFQELLPLRLKNRVSGKGVKSSNVCCLQEMAILFSCLKTNEFSQAPCAKEISNFQNCYAAHVDSVTQKNELEQKGVISSSKNLGYKQVNQILKKFPAMPPQAKK